MMKTRNGDDELLAGDDETELTTLQLLTCLAEDGDGGAHDSASTATGGLPAAVAVTRATGGDEAVGANTQLQSLFAFDGAAALLLDVDFSLDLDVDVTGVDLSSIDAVNGEDDRPPSADTSASHEPLQLQNDAFKSSRGPATTAYDTAIVPEFICRGRKNAKKELAYLREQVQALEQQLFSLQHPVPGASSRVSSPSSSSDTSAAAVWEQIAQRQQIEKQKAEVENVKLRELLEGQLRVANSLEKILHKRPNASVRRVRLTRALTLLFLMPRYYSLILVCCLILMILMQLSGSRPLKRTQALRSDFDWRARTSVTLRHFFKTRLQVSIRSSTVCYWRLGSQTQPTRSAACR